VTVTVSVGRQVFTVVVTVTCPGGGIVVNPEVVGVGALPGTTREYSLMPPVSGEILPIWFLDVSVNHRSPSGPAVMV
jgi:hypothetical protein